LPHSLEVLPHDLHELLEWLLGAELNGFSIFQGLKDVAGMSVVGLPRAYDVFAAVGVGEPDLPFEVVTSVLRLTSVVGKVLEEFWAAQACRYRLEVDIVVTELGHAPFVVA